MVHRGKIQKVLIKKKKNTLRNRRQSDYQQMIHNSERHNTGSIKISQRNPISWNTKTGLNNV